MQLFILWIVFLPLAQMYTVYEGVKIFVFWLGGIGLSLWWLHRLTHEKFQLPIVISDYLFLAWLGIISAASAFGVHSADSFVGGDYRHQGVLFFWLLWLIGLTIRLMRNKYRQLLYIGFSGGVLVESMLLLWQRFGGIVRPGGTFGEPNAAAGFLALGTIFLFSVYDEFRVPIWAKIILTGLVAVAELSTGSRTGIILFAFLFFVQSLKKSIWFFIICIAVISAILFAAQIPRPVSLYESRALFLQYGWEALLQRPVLGYGAESTAWVYDRIFFSHHIKLVDFMVDRSHNIFLDVALWSGFVGLFVFVGWLTALFIEQMKKKKWGTVIAMGIWVIFASVQPIGVVHWILFVAFVNSESIAGIKGTSSVWRNAR